MNVTAHHLTDLDELRRRIRRQANAKQRDRLRAVLLALEGKTTAEIMDKLARSKNFVQRWVYFYRDGGLERVRPRKQPGKSPLLARDQHQAFLDRINSSSRILRGHDVVEILHREFGVVYSLNGAYALLHRLGYEPLKPRPVNPKKDPEDEQAWKDSAPPFVQAIRQAYPDKTVEVWFQDECRFGQKGCLTYVWAPRGSRPVRPLQNEYEWVYLYGAVNPLTGESCALILPWANTEMMQMHLEAMSQQVGPDRHVVLVLILDNAGWHTTGRLEIPSNITMLPLPAYTPELNVVERLWHWIKDHQFSNRVYENYDELADAVCMMWQAVPHQRIRSVCRCTWLHEN